MNPITESIAYSESVALETPRRGNAYLIGAGFLVAGVLIAALWLTGGNTTVKLVQTTAFLLLGYGFSVVTGTRLSTLADGEQWLYAVALSGLMALAVAGGYFFYARLNWSVVMLNAAAFLLPFAMGKTREAFDDMAGASPPLWYYVPGSAAQPGVVSLHATPVRMKLRTRIAGVGSELFSFSAPGRMRIGNILYHIISESANRADTAIDWADAAGEAYGWTFYRSRFGGLVRQYLQPDGTLIENNIKRNAVIVAERVMPATD